MGKNAFDSLQDRKNAAARGAFCTQAVGLADFEPLSWSEVLPNRRSRWR
jgi:hypothetical protein